MRPLPSLPDDQLVWVNTRGSLTPGRVVEQARSPRSYLVETSTGRIRRTRHHLHVRSRPTVENSNDNETEETPHVIQTRLRTGTQIRPPDGCSYSLRRGDVVDNDLHAHVHIEIM